MRILYLGLPLGALRLAAAGFRPVAACLGHPRAPGARRVRRLIGARGGLVLGRPELGDPRLREALAAARPDALLSFFWPRRVPGEVVALAPRGAFGVHPSLLPRWRGPDPTFWTIAAGDAWTGVTLHRLEPAYDVGAVVKARRLPIGPGDDAGRLSHRLDPLALELLVECAARLAAGEVLEGKAQDETLATQAPRPSERDLSLDFRSDAAGLERLVRAAAPSPLAIARLGDTEVEVLRARVYEGAVPAALHPTEAFAAAEGLVVRAGSGALLLERVRAGDQVLRGAEVCALLRRS